MPLEKSIAIVLAGLSLAAQGAESAASRSTLTHKTAQPDVQFLEYLGAMESDDENWTDIAKGVVSAPVTKDGGQETVRPPTRVESETAAKRAESKR